MAKPSRACIPLEKRLTGVSMNASTPAKATISAKRVAISRLGIPMIVP